MVSNDEVSADDGEHDEEDKENDEDVQHGDQVQISGENETQETILEEQNEVNDV